jgi:flagellar basal-body rod protein FlgF
VIRGIYTSASGMLAEQKRLDVIANNLANVSTTGYKRETTVSQSFPDLLISRIHDPAGPQPVGRLNIGTFVANTATRLTTGSLRPTGNPLDVAIAGDGFFAVNTLQGVRYTRQGSFVQNAQGTLVTQEGYEVLVGGNPVTAEAGALTIGSGGEVTANGNLLGQLTVVTSLQLGAMRKEGGNLWVQAGVGGNSALVSPAEANGRFELKVGFLEASNVEAVTEMVEMMTVMRSFEANQKALQAQDETLQKAATEVGRI